MRYAIYILALFALVSCDRHRNHPGWDYFPDMFYSTAYETYSDNPNFEDGKTMRAPVEGSVPRGHVPFEYNISAESRARAGEDLINPFTADPVLVERGKKAYEIFCIGCHGSTGQGDGHLFAAGLYPMKPRPIAGPAAAALRDGEIYHTITLGFGSMGPHGPLVMPDDRWKIVLYIRQLQQQVK